MVSLKRDATYDYWRIELRRLLLALGLGLILGYITSYWTLSLLIVASAYIAWTLFKLRELQAWLAAGQPADTMPDSDGAWEQITYLIHRSTQKSIARKSKQRELLQRFDNIMSALPDAAVLLNQDHMIQWSNRAAQDLLGLRQPTDLGQRLDNLVRVKELSDALKNHTDSEIRFVPRHNDRLHLVARLVPVQENLYLLTARDISQRLQLQETRRAFFANASHELRTPLTVLIGYLELFEQDEHLPVSLLPAVQESRTQAQRMQRIIEDMLALSRLENDAQRRKAHTVVDVPAVFAQMASAIQATMAADSHTLSTDIDPQLLIRGHESDIVSIISNLTENAVKHTPAGTHIHIEWRQASDGQICLVVEDDGPGIPAQHINHLTERFYRVDTGRSRDKGGTGLGLAIVKHVMLNHDGKLEISSRPNKTRFKACFPAERRATA
ncbi:phosphate regulon sensor histidine kinase PhoR [Thiolinea disciformis]|uniref:phosphate regulon sensor histidine kinase PhoR n=1 Tax=Thiolinea disciformis TaxID=125614 RepID=UPI00037F6DBC